MTLDLKQCRDNFKQRTTTQRAERETLRHQAREEEIAAILQVIPQYPQITKIYLFGSITQSGQFHQHSDIDIAVAGTDAATYFAVWRDLEAVCSNWLIDLREINPPSHFTDIVLQSGKLVYESTSGPAQGEH